MSELTMRLEKANYDKKVFDLLKGVVDTHKMVDVGTGAERYLDITREHLLVIIYNLEKEGYNLFRAAIPKVTGKGFHCIQVLCSPDIPFKEVTRTLTDKNGAVRKVVRKVSKAIFDTDKIFSLANLERRK